MRLYSFVNYYLSDLQRGLQTAHVVAELGASYPRLTPQVPLITEEPATRILWDWAINHKTIIILNGGNSAELIKLYNELVSPLRSRYPVAFFEEDEASLNMATTAVGIVLPAMMYEAVQEHSQLEIETAFTYAPEGFTRSWARYEVDTPEWKLLKALKTYRLA